MCGDNNLPPAPSLGDAIAIIHMQAAPGESLTALERSWKLQLSNRFAAGNEEHTKVLYDVKPDWWRSDLKLRIQ